MSKETRNEIVPAQLPATALANIDTFLEATATESAKFLKFAKGDWSSGVDEEEVAVGTEMVPNIGAITCGHIR